MFIIGISGGSGSGKSFLTGKLRKEFSREELSIIGLDSYYRDHSHIPIEERQQINFDHPSEIDYPLLIEHVRLLKAGSGVEIPCYSFINCTRQEQTVLVKPASVLVIEGLFVLYNRHLRSQIDEKIHINTPAQQRLQNIIERDSRERGRNESIVRDRFHIFVEPAQREIIEPLRKFADIQFDWSVDHIPLLDHVRDIIRKKSILIQNN